MQFWKLKFGHKAKFCSDFEHKVWPRVWSWSSPETFETEVWSVFCCWGLVRLWSECLVKILMLKFIRKILNFRDLIKICVRTCFFGKQNSTLGSVVPLAMFYILAIRVAEKIGSSSPPSSSSSWRTQAKCNAEQAVPAASLSTDQSTVQPAKFWNIIANLQWDMWNIIAMPVLQQINPLCSLQNCEIS